MIIMYHSSSLAKSNVLGASNLNVGGFLWKNEQDIWNSCGKTGQMDILAGRVNYGRKFVQDEWKSLYICSIYEKCLE